MTLKEVLCNHCLMTEVGVVYDSSIKGYVVRGKDSDYFVIFNDWNTFYAVFSH